MNYLAGDMMNEWTTWSQNINWIIKITREITSSLSLVSVELKRINKLKGTDNLKSHVFKTKIPLQWNEIGGQMRFQSQMNLPAHLNKLWINASSFKYSPMSPVKALILAPLGLTRHVEMASSYLPASRFSNHFTLHMAMNGLSKPFPRIILLNHMT